MTTANPSVHPSSVADKPLALLLSHLSSFIVPQNLAEANSRLLQGQFMVNIAVLKA